MLIIFDLDDTLVDTSGCLIPFKLEEALRSMVVAGLEVPDFKRALDCLQACNREAESAREALKHFLGPLNSNPLFLEIGIKIMYEEDLLDLPLKSLEGAQEVLSALSSMHQLALVTVGQPLQQMNKLKKAGIDSSLFSKIIVSGERSKKGHYEAIAHELGYSSDQVWVCGDRVAVDLVPAADLGFRTVQMRWGRGMYSQGPQESVHYSISSLKELLPIVCKSISKDPIL